MNTIIRHAKSAWLTFDQIDFPEKGRPTNATDVVALANWELFCRPAVFA